MSTRHGSAPTELVKQKLIWIVFAFMLIGPPIGGLTLWLARWISALFSPEHMTWAGEAARFTLEKAVTSFLLMTGFSYWVGAAPAAIAGAALGFVQIRYGRTPWYVALACGVAVGVGYAGYFYILPSRAGVNASASIYESTVLVLICVVPTLVCWTIMRRWYGDDH